MSSLIPKKITILDGGLGRELARKGAPFRQPEWSALALYESPASVSEAHQSFVDAGSEVITTNSYAIVPFHIGEERFQHDGRRLAALAGELARQVADNTSSAVLVAGSIPPALGSYRPDLFEKQEARRIQKVLIEAQTPYVDVWLGETISSLEEAETIADLLKDQTKPFWLSFTLQDDPGIPHDQATLRSGESVRDAAALAIRLGAQNLLFNCSHPEVMLPAVQQAHAVIDQQGSSIGIGVYANTFVEEHGNGSANEGLSDLRQDLTPSRYDQYVEQWINAGATLVGGCCGITPDHIAYLAQRFKTPH